MFRKSQQTSYCAFCREPRKIFRQRHLNALGIIQCLAITMSMMWIFFQDWDFRALVIFAAVMGLAEVFVMLRWRFSIVCRSCGFDPVLYLRDRNLAAQRVKLYMEVQSKDPYFAFTKKAQVHLALHKKNKKPRKASILSLKA